MGDASKFWEPDEAADCPSVAKCAQKLARNSQAVVEGYRSRQE